MSVDEMPCQGNAPRRLASPVSTVALWWCALDWDRALLDEGEALLSPEERMRANRYGRPALRDRYVAGRVSLRRILGVALGCDANRVPLARGPRGRPYVEGARTLDFNVTNTRQRALIGVGNEAGGLRIGVDLEHKDRATDAQRLARKFLTLDERRELAALPPAEQRVHFLRWWTCKEAMSKATGDGLAAPFGALCVTLEPALRLRAGPAPYDPAHWQLWPVMVPGDYIGTLALWREPQAPA
jgi:4'-phosphopantetheinyl transferase